MGGMSALAAISRQECMLSMGLPTSTLLMARRAAVMGPMVLPQGMSLRETKCWGVRSFLRQARVKRAAAGASVA